MIIELKQHGPTLLVADQPATIGTLPVAVAQVEGMVVAYLPWLAIRNLHAVERRPVRTTHTSLRRLHEASRTLSVRWS